MCDKCQEISIDAITHCEQWFSSFTISKIDRSFRVTIRSMEKWKSVRRWKSTTKHNYILMQVTRGRPLSIIIEICDKILWKIGKRKQREAMCVQNIWRKLFLIRNWVSQTVLQCWTFPPLWSPSLGLRILELLFLLTEMNSINTDRKYHRMHFRKLRFFSLHFQIEFYLQSFSFSFLAICFITM